MSHFLLSPGARPGGETDVAPHFQQKDGVLYLMLGDDDDLLEQVINVVQSTTLVIIDTDVETYVLTKAEYNQAYRQ